jgi:hypothetical protein
MVKGPWFARAVACFLIAYEGAGIRIVVVDAEVR